MPVPTRAAALEVWLTKLEDYLKGGGAWAKPEAVKKLLTDRGVKLVGAAYQGGLLLTQGEERRAQFTQLQHRLSLCQEFGIETLIIVPDVAEKLSAEDVGGFKSPLFRRRNWRPPLACGWRWSSAAIRTGVQVCRPRRRWWVRRHRRTLGLCLDLFHYYTGPSKFEDLGVLSKENLFAVQLCDLAGVARELASDSDRILPGEGDFLLGPILDHLRHIDYTGYVSVELMNPDIWKMKPVQVAEAAYTCLRMVLGQAKGAETLRAVD